MRLTLALFILMAMIAPALAEMPGAAPAPGASGGLSARAVAPTASAAVTSTAAQDVIIKTLPGIVIDTKAREVRLEAVVCLRQGSLELLACEAGTKEHESIFAVRAKPSQVTFALALLGLEPGAPGKTLDRNVYRPPSGEVVDVLVRFLMPNGQVQEMPAWKLLRLSGRPEALERPLSWVYVGVPSADALKAADDEGTVICLSNFLAAVLDVPFESTAVNANLAYDANTAALPPLGTKAELVLHPTGRRIAAQKLSIEVVVRKGQPILLDGEPMDLEQFRQTAVRLPANIRLAFLRADAAESFGRIFQIYELLTDEALMAVQMSVLEPGAPTPGARTATVGLTVTDDGKVRLGTETMTLEDFRAKAAKLLAAAAQVDVTAEPKAPAKTVSDVLAAVREAGAVATMVPAGKK
jgi:biopolymer transport protein ExbD